MPFLSTDFDLSGTRFTGSDLSYARRYWQFVIERVDSAWLEDPTGELAIHWRSDTVPSAVRLIELARIIWRIRNGVTDESQLVLDRKVETLLHSSGRQQEELIFELMVGSLLLSRELEMQYEPLMGCDQPEQSRSVDFLVLDEEQPVFVEATRTYLQAITDWEIAVEGLKRRFEREMMRASCVRQLEIWAPLCVTPASLDGRKIRRVMRQVVASPKGRARVDVSGHTLVFEWMPVPHLPALTGAGPGDGGFAFIAGNAEVAMVAATRVHLRWPGDAEDRVLRSLRNTLDQKRQQFSGGEPYVLAVARGNGRIPKDGVLDLFHRRLFPNSIYRWITGVLLFDVKFSQTRGFDVSATLMRNPGADQSLPENFVSRLLAT